MKCTNKKERNKKRGTRRVKGGGWFSNLFGKSASIAPEDPNAELYKLILKLDINTTEYEFIKNINKLSNPNQKNRIRNHNEKGEKLQKDMENIIFPKIDNSSNDNIIKDYDKYGSNQVDFIVDKIMGASKEQLFYNRGYNKDVDSEYYKERQNCLEIAHQFAYTLLQNIKHSVDITKDNLFINDIIKIFNALITKSQELGFGCKAFYNNDDIVTKLDNIIKTLEIIQKSYIFNQLKKHNSDNSKKPEYKQTPLKEQEHLELNKLKQKFISCIEYVPEQLESTFINASTQVAPAPAQVAPAPEQVAPAPEQVAPAPEQVAGKRKRNKSKKS